MTKTLQEHFLLMLAFILIFILSFFVVSNDVRSEDVVDEVVGIEDSVIDNQSKTDSQDVGLIDVVDVENMEMGEEDVEQGYDNPVIGLEEVSEDHSTVTQTASVVSVVDNFSRELSAGILRKRDFTQKINIDKRIINRCESESFRIDISDKEEFTVRLLLLNDPKLLDEIEIGGLPYGIDVSFDSTTTPKYKKSIKDRTSFLDIYIKKHVGAQEGDFTVPIIYTSKDDRNTSSICQVNLINQ